jgi:hypothetical protein
MDAESREAETRPSMASSRRPHYRWSSSFVFDYPITTSSIHIIPCGVHSVILCSFLDLHIFPPPNISFLRRFFASSVNPATMSAAKTKAQKIIDENAVGMNTRCLENLNGS